MSKKSTTFRTLHYYWAEIKKYKWYSLGVMVLTPLVVFIRAILAPMIFADLIEKVSLGLPLAELLAIALTEVIGFFVLYIINKIVFEELRLYCCWRMEILAMYNLANLCFDTISAQSMQFHSNRFSGSLVSQTNRFIGSFERFCDVIIWDLWPTISYIIMVMIVLGGSAPWFAIGLVVFVVIYSLISGFSFRKIAEYNEAEAEASNRQTGQLADSITNIISVKSYAHESHERHRYANFARATYNASDRVMRKTIGRDLAFSTVSIGITGLLLVFLLFGREWLGLSIATMILIVNYSQSILGELWSINHIFKNINRSFGDAAEMTRILDTVDDVVDVKDAVPLKLADSSVQFDQVSFQHQDAKEAIFTNFDLDIQPGERVGLVGVSGSGKTTLTKLLLRFADVDQGQILIAGQDVKTVTQKSLRENIAYVPQETSLFHRSIAENIAYGRPNASQQEIERAAELANAHEFIKDLPEGYKTLVGERGIKLSGGQRQRIAIARAILKDAPILVLDEATSALDSESEALIQDALTKLMKGRTSIVIAHRLSTVASLDRIIVLQDGQIVEQGSHADLLKNPDGVYQHLWSRQSGAFAED